MDDDQSQIIKLEDINIEQSDNKINHDDYNHDTQLKETYHKLTDQALEKFISEYFNNNLRAFLSSFKNYLKYEENPRYPGIYVERDFYNSFIDRYLRKKIIGSGYYYKHVYRKLINNYKF